MNYKSLLELLEEEKRLCGGLQLRANIIDAVCEVDLEDEARAEKHRLLRERLVRETMQMAKTLQPLRVAIGARIMELERMAVETLRAEMENGVPQTARASRAAGPARRESGVQAFSPQAETLETAGSTPGVSSQSKGSPDGPKGPVGEVRS